MEEENNKSERPKSIDDLLADDSMLPAEGSSGLPVFNEHEPMNYATVKSSSQNQAKKMMNSLLKFYLSEELINKNEYIVLKAKVEVMTMANLINQMQIAEHAIETLMRTIDSGEFSPRMFEVLGGLQKTMLEIMKHQTLHMMAAEENMKKMKRDIDIYGDDSGESSVQKSDSGGGRVVRGTRGLMMELNAEEIEDISPEDAATDFDSDEQTEM